MKRAHPRFALSIFSAQHHRIGSQEIVAIDTRVLQEQLGYCVDEGTSVRRRGKVSLCRGQNPWLCPFHCPPRAREAVQTSVLRIAGWVDGQVSDAVYAGEHVNFMIFLEVRPTMSVLRPIQDQAALPLTLTLTLTLEATTIMILMTNDLDAYVCGLVRVNDDGTWVAGGVGQESASAASDIMIEIGRLADLDPDRRIIRRCAYGTVLPLKPYLAHLSASPHCPHGWLATATMVASISESPLEVVQRSTGLPFHALSLLPIPHEEEGNMANVGAIAVVLAQISLVPPQYDTNSRYQHDPIVLHHYFECDAKGQCKRSIYEGAVEGFWEGFCRREPAKARTLRYLQWISSLEDTNTPTDTATPTGACRLLTIPRELRYIVYDYIPSPVALQTYNKSQPSSLIFSCSSAALACANRQLSSEYAERMRAKSRTALSRNAFMAVQQTEIAHIQHMEAVSCLCVSFTSEGARDIGDFLDKITERLSGWKAPNLSTIILLVRVDKPRLRLPVKEKSLNDKIDQSLRTRFPTLRIRVIGAMGACVLQDAPLNNAQRPDGDIAPFTVYYEMGPTRFNACHCIRWGDKLSEYHMLENFDCNTISSVVLAAMDWSEPQKFIS